MLGEINEVEVRSFQDYSTDIGEAITTELHLISNNTKKLCNYTTTLLPAAITEHSLSGIFHCLQPSSCEQFLFFVSHMNHFSQKCIEITFIKPPKNPIFTKFFESEIGHSQSFTIFFTPGIEKVDIFRAFSSDSHLGKIDSKRIGDQVIITVARSPGAPCGPAYVLRCTSSLRCAVVQTIITNAPTMEFLSYETFEAILVWHWDSGSNSTHAACKTEPEIYRYSFVCFHAVSLVSSTTSGIFSGFLIHWLDRVFHHLPI